MPSDALLANDRPPKLVAASFVRVADRSLFVNAAPFERSRSHGRRYACLLVEAFPSIAFYWDRCIHDTKRVFFWAMLHIWNAHNRVL